MSRSTRKTPICGITTSESEKLDKRFGNRKVRRANRMRLTKGEEPIQRHAMYDPWMMDKDGKQYFNQDRFPELMRK